MGSLENERGTTCAMYEEQPWTVANKRQFHSLGRKTWDDQPAENGAFDTPPPANGRLILLHGQTLRAPARGSLALSPMPPTNSAEARGARPLPPGHPLATLTMSRNQEITSNALRGNFPISCPFLRTSPPYRCNPTDPRLLEASSKRISR